MRVQLLVAILVFVQGPIALAQEADPRRVAVDAWFDQRWDADPAELIKLIGDDVVELEQLLRAGRVTFPEPAAEQGTLVLRSVSCEHVDYATEALLYVPRTYDPGQPTSLLLIGHGGNGAMNEYRAMNAAQGGIEPWIGEADKRGWILAAPLTTRGWGAIGNSILLTVISELQRELNIDPDRIYVTGMSMGGHLSWRSGILLGDRWGAVSPMSGGYDYVDNELVCLLVNVPGYATWGTREPYGIAGFNRKIRDWMGAHNFDWVNVQKKGGHLIYWDEIPKVADFFAARPRDLYRTVVYARGNRSLRWDDPGNSGKWKREHSWDPGRPIPRSTFHWVRLVPRDDAGKDSPIDQRVCAVNEGGNRLVLTTSGVQRLRLFLHPRMVDLSRPVTVVVNGEIVHEGMVEPDARTMLELVREFDDRTRIYHAALDLTIDTEAEVPPPVRPD